MPDTHLEELLRNPSFSIDRMGYSSMEVHRLWRELNAAHKAGEPLGPIVDAAKFTEVSFGYDINAVTEALMAISDASDAGQPVTAGPVPSEPTPAAPPVSADDVPLVADAGSHSAQEAALQPSEDLEREASLAAERMVVHLQSARFPVTRTGPRYVMDAVDDVLDHLTSEANQQRPLAHIVQNVRLPMETRSQGYECGAVDDLLDEILIGSGSQPSGQPGTGHLYVPQPIGQSSFGSRSRPYNKQAGVTAVGVFVGLMILMVVLGMFF